MTLLDLNCINFECAVGIYKSICLPLNGTILESVFKETRCGRRVESALSVLAAGAVVVSWSGQQHCSCPAASMGVWKCEKPIRSVTCFPSKTKQFGD